MGSLNAPGIPVPAKTPLSYRKMDIRITQTDAANDIIQQITANRPETNRHLGSGCIVRDQVGGAAADCTQTVVWGLYKEANSTSQRIASDVNAVRSLNVPTSGNTTIAVIETSLQPHTPQISVRSLGTHIDRRNSVSDGQIDSVISEGPYDPLAH